MMRSATLFLPRRIILLTNMETSGLPYLASAAIVRRTTRALRGIRGRSNARSRPGRSGRFAACLARQGIAVEATAGGTPLAAAVLAPSPLPAAHPLRLAG